MSRNFNKQNKVHSWLGYQKGKKGLKDFLELLFTHNISMKQN
jgi:hypothetical protein